MTELQMGLIGLGATAVIGVLGYNKWQEYRHRKLAEAVLKPQHDDVLLADAPAKVAPAVRSEPELRAEAPDAPAERREPVLADGLPAAADESAASEPALRSVPLADDDEIPELPAGSVPGSLLDPRLEFIVAMELVDPVPASQIIHSQYDALRRVSKPVHWVTFNERNREWERIAPDSEAPVRRLRVGLQLVDRMGPVS
ncbi:MAG: cell division protein FtsZ, partial [Azonexus sp.]